jgi:hypothetical protein
MLDSAEPIEACEDILLDEKRYNGEHEILPSENAIIDRLLNRRLELADAYDELHQKLSGRPHALKTLLGLVLSVAAFWGPEQIAEARSERTRLKEVNRRIADKAAELAALVQERSELHNKSGFWTNTHYHVAKVVEGAATGNYLFRSFLRDPLHRLRGQFDLKYWPGIEDFLNELARNAREADLEAADPVTAAATTGVRNCLADFFEALFASIEENSTGSCGFIPTGLKLTDNTLATLANCALDLAPDDMVDGAYVKRWRQRKRERARPRRRDAA